MEYQYAKEVAEKIKGLLEPHCERIEIAGSIRRKKPTDIKDVEIVCIPKPYDVGLFQSGIAKVISKWPKIKGELPCKYTQRIYMNEGFPIKVDIFFANPLNWGMILAIRTGSADFSKNVLANTWVKKGYFSKDGILWKYGGKQLHVTEEKHLFELLELKWVEPEFRI